MSSRTPRAPSRQAMWRDPLGAAIEPTKLALNAQRLARLPRGDRRPVIVLPGFGAGDASTTVLRRYLRTIGYDARGWGLGRNIGDVVGAARSIHATLSRLHESRARPTPLIGWSLGGVIAREVARESPHLVEQVITFGSPIVGGPKYTTFRDGYLARGLDLDAIEARIAERNRRPIRVPVTAIYTKGDGVVDWRACIDEVTPDADNIEVNSTHVGLGINHEVFEIIARKLAAASRRR